MIASFSNNFIFLKTTKTAGTSVEIVLSSWCSGRDICTMMPDEDLRVQYGGRAMNYMGWFGRKKYWNHMPARDVSQKLPKLWDTAFKFTVERHPYERVVSRAYWQIARRGETSQRYIQAEIDGIIEARTFLNRPIYTLNERIAVDQVLLYDDLWPGIARLAERFGKPMPTNLPQAKAQHRTDRRPAREILSAGQKNAILQIAEADFRDFGFAR